MSSNKETLTPTQAWQTLLAYLFQQHYGLTLNDTPFCENQVIQEHINAGISLADAVNFQVERYALIRTDRDGFSWEEPYLNCFDILRARRATGIFSQTRGRGRER